MLTLKQRLALATDDKERAYLHYQLAKKYLQLTIDGNCWAYIHYSWSVASREGNDYIANNIKQFRKLAKDNLQESLKLNNNVTNRVNCLFALASMSEESPWRTYEYSMKKQKDVVRYHPKSIQAIYFAQLYKLRSSKEFIHQGLSRCDNLKSYLRYCAPPC